MDGAYAYTPYIWPMLVSTLLPAALALYAWKHRTVPGAAWFAVMEVFTALWALFTAVEMAATTESAKILWFKLETLVAIPVMAALLCFALEYANPGKWLTRRNVLLPSLPLLLTAILIVTNDLHHLFWTRFWFDGFVRIERGPLNAILLVYALLLPLLAILVFLRLLIRTSGFYRWQALLLFGATVLPFLTFLLEPAGINPVAPLDPVILVLNINGLLFMLGIYYFGMLGVVPIGRDTAMERMASGALILDAEYRIVDLNPAAEAVLGLSRPAAVRHPAAQALAAHPDLLRLIQQETEAGAEITSDGGGQSRFYQVHVSPLLDRNRFKLGQLILLQDVTEQKQARELLLHEQRSRAIMQERERLARELHDSLGQTLAASHLMTETAKRLLARGETAQTDECLDRLADITLEAEADVREYLLGVQTFLSADRHFFPSLRQYLGRFSQRYGLNVELTIAPQLEEQGLSPAVGLQMLRVIQEALSNVRKHARAHRVQVSLTIAGPQARIVIADDGQGFDPAAVAAQDEGFGLQAMRERVEAVGGGLQVISNRHQGTQIVVTVPLAEDTGMGIRGDGEMEI